MYRNILVPHAGNSAGDQALKHAIAIAKCSGARITILHIVEDMPVPLSLAHHEREKLADGLTQIGEEMEKEMYEQLGEKAVEFGEQKIEIGTKIVHGHPDKEIVRVAASEESDLIVMAKRNRLTGIKSVLKMGSVSRKVLEQVSCPLLLVDGKLA